MATFTTIEREMMEDAFDMRSGGVLDMGRRSFAGFIQENLGFDVWSHPDYINLSRAKALRSILSSIPEAYAGKVLLKLIEYKNFKDIKNCGDKYISKLTDIAYSKLGRNPSSKSSPQREKKAINHNKLMSLLLAIDSSNQTKQQKGYAFEKFLYELLNAYSLDPRHSYRTEYDQVDGSFTLNDHTVILEAKYRGTEPSKDDLILFSNKLNRRSNTVRGLFICLCKISEKTINYFIGQQNKNFVVMTVEEVFLLCQNKYDFTQLLNSKFRHLDETGEIFKHYLELT